jgi:glycogen(starch) synthase
MSSVPGGPERPAAPRRVLMTADAVGGVWTYALELSRALGLHGVEVELAVLGSPTAGQAADARAVPNVRLVSAPYRLEWMDDPWEDVERSGEWLLELAHARGADLVHLNGYAHGALAWEAPVVVVGHSCVLTWWEAVRREPAPARWDRYRDAVRAGIAGADLVVAPSRAMLEGLERHYGPVPRARVVHNGRSAERLQPAGTKEPFVLAAGRLWDEAKNLAALDRVAASIPWPVYVAGDAIHPDGGLAGVRHVEPLGLVPAAGLADWFARASVYALPARYEPFGLSVLEAALAGCALVLGDLGSLREIWEDAPLYVDPFSDEGLLDALRAVVSDPALRARLASRARERARSLSPEAMAGGYLAAYAQARASASVRA